MREDRLRRPPVLDSQRRRIGILPITDIAQVMSCTSGHKALIADTMVLICTPHRQAVELRSEEPAEEHQQRSS